MTPPTQMVFFTSGGITFSWLPVFNAVHMALIPKGPYRGMVLVWDKWPVLARDPTYAPAHPPNTWRSFQPYSIIDPIDFPVASGGVGDPPVRYRNRLLPIGPTIGVSPSGIIRPFDLFCSGHTWSNFGDLIVVGGTEFNAGFYGATMTHVWNANAVPRSYPGTGVTMYPGSGMWVEGQRLASPRWYPTATLTHPLARTQVGPRKREIVAVLGGSDQDPNLQSGCNPPLAPQASWNSIEALIVDAVATPGNFGGIIKDSQIGPGIASPGSIYIGDGPGTPGGSPDVDWMEEYPRCHQLSSGELFVSGYGPRWGSWFPETVPVTAQWTASGLISTWAKAPGQQLWPSGTFSSNWNHPRHDAPSLLFPRLSGVPDEGGDRIMRIGGADDHFYRNSAFGSTETVESIAPLVSPDWEPEPIMTTTGGTPSPRYLCNAVILPTGAIFVVGGTARSPSPCNTGSVPTTSALLFENGAWTQMPSPASVRDYHSTAILLPDGRVFVGGGEGRISDYEIFSPAYRTNQTLATTHKPSNLAFSPVPFTNVPLGAPEIPYASGVPTSPPLTIAHKALPTGVVIDRVVLMAPGSVTHHSDMSARHVSLPIISKTVKSVTFTGPLDAMHAPRGAYMLFLITNSGAVPDALWVALP